MSAPARLARRVLKPAAAWILSRAARAYVAGDDAEDAERLVARLARRGLGATVGFWNDERDAPRAVADQYLECLRRCRPGDYVSIKLPALGWSRTLFDELAAAAAPPGTRLHFDAMQPDTAERTCVFVDALPEAVRARCGVTLPGRWARSVGDAAWATERRLAVRVVKGQWPDPLQPDIEPRAGFERVVGSLAGRAAQVAVATHDAPLVRAALGLLAAAGTRCELELLHGLPRRQALAAAAPFAVPARIYVGYGYSFVPYAVGGLLDDPRRLLWLLRDAAGLGAR